MIELNLALVGTVSAWLAVAVGITLAARIALRKSAVKFLLWMHPVFATVAVFAVWTAIALWQGANDLQFNAGALILTLAFVAGAFLFFLRLCGLRPPLIAAGLHGAVALVGCVLLTFGLPQLSGVVV